MKGSHIVIVTKISRKWIQ